MEKNQQSKQQDKKPTAKKNKFAIAGFVLGVVSIFFASIGIIPILALIFSSIGLYQIGNRKEESGKVLAIIGLILGIVYTIVYMGIYGHF